MREVAAVLKNQIAEAAGIWMHKNLMEGGTYRKTKDWLTESITNVAGQIPDLEIVVSGDEEEEKMKELIKRVNHKKKVCMRRK